MCFFGGLGFLHNCIILISYIYMFYIVLLWDVDVYCICVGVYVCFQVICFSLHSPKGLKSRVIPRFGCIGDFHDLSILRRCECLANASTSQGISEKGYDSRADFKLHSTLDLPRDLAIFYWLPWPNPWQFDLANVFKSEYSIEWMRWISQTMNGEDVVYIQMPYLVNDASCSESHQTPSTQVIFDFCLFIFPAKADIGPWSMTSQLASKH